jgi:Na+/H+ antiporter NhaA
VVLTAIDLFVSALTASQLPFGLAETAGAIWISRVRVRSVAINFFMDVVLFRCGLKSGVRLSLVEDDARGSMLL